MTKRELMQELQIALDEKNISSLDGINANCAKHEIENAINCLRCPDETMAEYLTVVKLKYPNTYRAITQSNYLRHRFNRLYVYNTARMAIAN